MAPEHDALIGAYEHLDRLPRAADALHMLRKIASLVKPIMRNRGWHVGILTEFYPTQQNLLGLNVNRGQKICLRLRYPRDQSLFLPIEQVVDTMLHELSHNVHGPHNEQFHALWEALRDEHEDLVRKGYTGDGFLSEGQRLGGGRHLPVHEMRRQAHAAAQRRTLTSGSGKKLGGAYIPSNTDIRSIIADAATRRTRHTQPITQGCASGAAEAENMADQASRNGFRTKAEEDEANGRAIAQALWELVQEEEARKVGIEDETWRSEGLVWNPATGLQPANPQDDFAKNTFVTPAAERSSELMGLPRLPTQSKPPPAPVKPRPKSPAFSVKEEEAQEATKIPSRKRPLSPSLHSPPLTPINAVTPPPVTWPCTICTLVNPITYLCCDACGGQRPAQYNNAAMLSSTTAPPGSKLSKPLVARTMSTTSVLKPRSGSENLLPVGESSLRKPQRLGWNCGRCGTFMENQWWTCSLCGMMKASS